MAVPTGAMSGAGAGAAAGAAGGGGIGKVNIDPNGFMGGNANFSGAKGSAMNIGGGLTNMPGNSGGMGMSNMPGGGGSGGGDNGGNGNGENDEEKKNDSQQMVNIETPGDSMNTATKPFQQYVMDSRKQAQLFMSDPMLRQITQPQSQQQPPVQQEQPKKKKDEDKQQLDLNEFQKMIEYVNAVKQKNAAKNQSNQGTNDASTQATK